MKTVSTTVKTGDIINYAGHKCRIGVIKNGRIQFTMLLSETSAITEHITTRELNKRLKTA
jgi:hypothetical protein